MNIIEFIVTIKKNFSFKLPSESFGGFLSIIFKLQKVLALLNKNDDSANRNEMLIQLKCCMCIMVWWRKPSLNQESKILRIMHIIYWICFGPNFIKQMFSENQVRWVLDTRSILFHSFMVRGKKYVLKASTLH